MQLRNRSVSRTKIETALLQFLCDAKSDHGTQSELLGILGSYNWAGQDNTIFFECIRELFAGHAAQILEHLPAALTRRGFPDISCAPLAAAAQLNPRNALALAQSLVQLNK